MPIAYVDPKRAKIFRKKPRGAKLIGRTRGTLSYMYTTNNPDPARIHAVVPRKGYQLRYSRR